VDEAVRVQLLQRLAQLEDVDHASRRANHLPIKNTRDTTSVTTNLIGPWIPLKFHGAILVAAVNNFTVERFKVAVGGAFHDEDPAVLVRGGLGVHLHNLLVLTRQHMFELVVGKSLQLGAHIVSRIRLGELKAVLRVDVAFTLLETSFNGEIVKEKQVILTASAVLLKALEFSLLYSFATEDRAYERMQIGVRQNLPLCFEAKLSS